MDSINAQQMAALLAIVGLAPAVVYIFRRGVDPFNPLIFIGGLSFAVVGRKLLLHPGPALKYLPESAYNQFLLLVICDLLALYAGWYLWKRRHRFHVVAPARSLAVYRSQFDVHRLYAVGTVMAFASAVAFAITYHRYHASGYLRDLTYLGICATVMLIQAYLLEPSLLWAVVPGIIAGAARPVVLFFTYGSRGQTGIMGAVFLATPYLFRVKRPPKIPLLVFVVILGITLNTLTQTRALVSRGEAGNRVSALWLAAKHMFRSQQRTYGDYRTFIVGTAQMVAVQKLDNYDWGGFMWNVAATFPPHEWFPHKIRWQTAWGSGPHGALHHIYTTTGIRLNGQAPTGFSDAYVNFWWFSIILWGLLGYFLHYIYAGAVYAKNIDFQGRLVVLYICLLYLIGQGLWSVSLEFLFTYIPIVVAYRFCRREQPLEVEPARPRPVAVGQALGSGPPGGRQGGGGG